MPLHQLPDSRQLQYNLYGAPGGKAVFFFHGWPSSRSQAAWFDQHARNLKLRIIAPNRPGFGQSTPQGKRRFSDWPADVEDLARHLGLERYGLLGLSGGAPYALACASRFGERITRTAILCGVPPFADPELKATLPTVYQHLQPLSLLAPLALPLFFTLWKSAIQGGPHHPAGQKLLAQMPPVDQDALRLPGAWNMMLTSCLEAIDSPTLSIVQDARLYLKKWDFDPANIETPVHFFHGGLDHTAPLAGVKILASRIPNACTRWLSTEGHFSLPINYGPDALSWLSR